MEKRKLPVKLTEDEVTQLGRAMADLLAKRGGVEDEKKTAKSEFKNRLDQIDEKLEQVGASVRTGHEEREIDCDWVKDFARKTADLVRSDTGEVVETRPLSAAEMQESLFPKKTLKPTAGKKLDMGDDPDDETGNPAPAPGEEGLGF
jgi:hypothetical protein